MFASIVKFRAVMVAAIHVLAVVKYGAKCVRRRIMYHWNHAVGILNFMPNYGSNVTQTHLLLMDGINCFNLYSI